MCEKDNPQHLDYVQIQSVHYYMIHGIKCGRRVKHWENSGCGSNSNCKGYKDR